MTDRHAQVVRVLRRVLVLNLAVAAAKIALGFFAGAVSILSDGFHSLTDAASNVVALIGVSAAQRPPDLIGDAGEAVGREIADHCHRPDLLGDRLDLSPS